MAYKKHRVSTRTIVLSLALMFLIGFFAAYNIANVQHNILEKGEQITAQSVEEVEDTKTATQLEGTARATTKVVAVSPKGDGVMGDVIVEIEPGDGKVLMNTNPFLEPDTQYSAVTAVEIAKEITKKDLKDKNVIIDFNVNGTVVGGPSAGAAMTIATIAAIENKPIKQGIAVTGTIEPDGTIGKVGSLVEKGEAAADNNYKTFLIPQGQNTFTYYERQVTKRNAGGLVFYNTRLIPKTIDLKELFQQERNMNVIEVSNIQQVMNYML